MTCSCTTAPRRWEASGIAGGGDWAVEFDGPSRSLASGAPSSATLLIRRTLQLLGHALVSVPYWEWAACRGPGEREQYLRSKLGACSPSAVHGRRLDEGTKAYQDVQAGDEAVSNSGGARSASNSTGARSAGSGAGAGALELVL